MENNCGSLGRGLFIQYWYYRDRLGKASFHTSFNLVLIFTAGGIYREAGSLYQYFRALTRKADHLPDDCKGVFLSRHESRKEKQFESTSNVPECDYQVRLNSPLLQE